MTDLLAIVGLSLLGGVVALAGGVVFLFVRSWSKALIHYSVPFAAGVLLTAGLVGLLPEAVQEIGEQAFLTALLAFLGAYLFENIFCDLHHHGERDKYGKTYSGSVWLVMAGDTVHNFIDGAAIAAAYLLNPGLGVITAVSTFLHEIPHEIGDFGILLKAGWPKGRILAANFVSALFSVLGALVVFYVVYDKSVIGNLLGVAAGMFLYLGASDFLPRADEEISRRKALTALILGISLMLAVFRMIPHSHETENHLNKLENNSINEDY